MARQVVIHAGLAFDAGARFVVSMVFYPPDGRRRDVSNLHAAMKAALDGIAEAMGVDDSGFVQHHQCAGHVMKVALAQPLERAARPRRATFRGATKGRVDVVVEELQ